MRKPPTIHAPHPRLVATFALIPLTFAAFLLAYTLAAFWIGNPSVISGRIWVWAIAISPVAVFYCGGLLVWWPTVRWTQSKRRGVLLVTTSLLLWLLACGFVAWAFPISVLATLIFLVGPLPGGAVALVAVSRITYDPPHLRAAEPRCPNCGYDLRGQRECRCPECGRDYTLGQLVSRPDDLG